MKEQLEAIGRELGERAVDSLEDAMNAGRERIEEEIREKLGTIRQRVTSSMQEAVTKFAGVDEEQILTFIPDKRTFDAIGPFLLGFVALFLLPGYLKLGSLFLFVVALFYFYIGYISNAKVDIPDGYTGVICDNGKPTAGTQAKPGRNWLFKISRFVPFLVSTGDQIVDATNANFTADFASVGLTNQIVFRVVDPAKFVATTSPAAIMKILHLYSSYIALRIITSIGDARVKFTGRDRLTNVMEALNAFLKPNYGIEVTRVSMPDADNDIIGDLETIRTQLQKINSMDETKQARKEHAIKAVESTLRSKIKESRSRALNLQQAHIKLATMISEQVNKRRQQLLINARRTLEQGVSALRKDVLSYEASLAKVQALKGSFDSLKTSLELRAAAIKRSVFKLLVPQQVDVFHIDGVGQGIGLNLGTQLLRNIATKQPQGDAKESGKSAGQTLLNEIGEKLTGEEELM